MADDIEQDELTTDIEIDDTPFVEFDISVSPSDPTLELLAIQIEKEDIIIPFYQRKFVWKIEQASKLIESFLMGLPVPQVFFYVNDDERLEIIDGQQRLLSITYFFEGFFGEADSSGKRQVFRLKGLADRYDYNGKTFKELSAKDQRKLRNSTLRAINIKQLKPNSRNDSVFYIFERLNTGGTPLKPQEIRNAVYRGNIVAELQQLNSIPEWQHILGLRTPDKNQKDVELVLRLFSLFENWNNYEKPMLSFLNKFMSANVSFDSDKALHFKKRFKEAVKIVDEALIRPFRPRGVLNSAVLEAVMISILEDKSVTPAALKVRYPRLLERSDFMEKITGGTTDTTILKPRISIAKSVIGNGAR